jgi:hypothetical protein
MHSIRLRGPWEIELLEQGASKASPSPGGRVKLPCEWGAVLGAGFQGTVVLKRTFHTPTGLDLGEQVWLVIDAVCGRAGVVLNDRPVGEFSTDDCPARYNITSLLTDDANLLTVRVTADAVEGLMGDVRLEIEE